MMDKTMNYISKRISRLQEMERLSDRPLSFALGRDGSYINAIHVGKSKPSLEGLVEICDYFGITICEFFNPEMDQ